MAPSPGTRCGDGAPRWRTGVPSPRRRTRVPASGFGFLLGAISIFASALLTALRRAARRAAFGAPVTFADADRPASVASASGPPPGRSGPGTADPGGT